MIYVLERLAYACLFFALLSCGGFIYYKVKIFIEKKKYPNLEKATIDNFFGKIGNTASKVYVTLLTAGMFAFMILNPAFRCFIGIAEQWNWFDVFLLLIDIISSVFTIISIILLDTNDIK